LIVDRKEECSFGIGLFMKTCKWKKEIRGDGHF
jgi:hypothetical protein